MSKKFQVWIDEELQTKDSMAITIGWSSPYCTKKKASKKASKKADGFVVTAGSFQMQYFAMSKKKMTGETVRQQIVRLKEKIRQIYEENTLKEAEEKTFREVWQKDGYWLSDEFAEELRTVETELNPQKRYHD